MTLVERVLMGPGPSYPYPDATAALAARPADVTLLLATLAEVLGR